MAGDAGVARGADREDPAPRVAECRAWDKSIRATILEEGCGFRAVTREHWISAGLDPASLVDTDVQGVMPNATAATGWDCFVLERQMFAGAHPHARYRVSAHDHAGITHAGWIEIGPDGSAVVSR